MIGTNLTIIGGSGGMGQVFAKYFKQHGFKITLYAQDEGKLKAIAEELEVNYELDLKKSILNADIVMISIPIHSTSAMIKKVAPMMKEDSLLFDINSLKRETADILYKVYKKHPINCLSIHPMFGPGIKNMKNYTIIVVKIGGTKQYNEIINDFLSIFRSDGIIIVETTPDIHDARIALTLGVPHMFNILFLNLLKNTGHPLNELTKFTGTTFLLQKVFAESIIQREMEMFGEIQIENDKFHEILDHFEDLIKVYKSIIKNNDLDGFKKLFSEALKYSKEDNHFRDSYKYFYEFMKVLKQNKE